MIIYGFLSLSVAIDLFCCGNKSGSVAHLNTQCPAGHENAINPEAYLLLFLASSLFEMK